MSRASIDRINGGGTTWGIGKTRSLFQRERIDFSSLQSQLCDPAARRKASGWLPTLDAEPNQPGCRMVTEPSGWLRMKTSVLRLAFQASSSPTASGRG